MLIVARTLHFSKFCTVGFGVFGKEIHNIGVVPAAARFGFLGSEHIFCVGYKNIRSFKGTHKAGVKADEFELIGHTVINRVKSTIYLFKGKAIFVVKLVEAYAIDTARTVVPENKPGFIGGIFL